MITQHGSLQAITHPLHSVLQICIVLFQQLHYYDIPSLVHRWATCNAEVARSVLCSQLSQSWLHLFMLINWLAYLSFMCSVRSGHWADVLGSRKAQAVSDAW